MCLETLQYKKKLMESFGNLFSLIDLLTEDTSHCGRTAGKLNPGLSYALESAGALLLINGQIFSDNVWAQARRLPSDPLQLRI